MSSSSVRSAPHLREPLAADYRRLAGGGGLVRFCVQMEETDLSIAAERDLSNHAQDLVRRHRQEVKDQIARQPAFLTALSPLPVDQRAAPLVRKMAAAGSRAGTGPMAAVAGAIAEAVGRGLLRESGEVIVENGGDVFCATARPRSFMLLAEQSAFGALSVRFDGGGRPFGVCTSAGTSGHSLSFGRADAMMVAARDTALADALATALCNRVQQPDDLRPVVEAACDLGAFGAVAIMGDHLAAFGALELER